MAAPHPVDTEFPYDASLGPRPLGVQGLEMLRYEADRELAAKLYDIAQNLAEQARIARAREPRQQRLDYRQQPDRTCVDTDQGAEERDRRFP